MYLEMKNIKKSILFLYYKAIFFKMIKRICFIIFVVIGLIVLIPESNVAAKLNFNHPHSLSGLAGLGFIIASLFKFHQHKQNPQMSFLPHIPFGLLH